MQSKKRAQDKLLQESMPYTQVSCAS